MNRINRNVFEMTMRHSRRISSPRGTRRVLRTAAAITIAALVGSASAGWLPGLPPGLRAGGGGTGAQAPSAESLLPGIFQFVRALAIVDQFPPSVVILFESYFTEWYLAVAVDDRTSSFSAFLVSQGVKDPADQAMHLILHDIVMRLMQCMHR